MNATRFRRAVPNGVCPSDSISIRDPVASVTTRRIQYGPADVAPSIVTLAPLVSGSLKTLGSRNPISLALSTTVAMVSPLGDGVLSAPNEYRGQRRTAAMRNTTWIILSLF